MICKSTAPVEERKAVETEVDDSIADFDRWFVSKGNMPMIHGERAIIKTYLYYMLFEANNGT